MKILEVGHSDFEKLMLSNNYFVDKTMFIYDFFTKGAYVSLFPRPKRFGKTLNLSMIEHFFDIQKQKSTDLFNELKISKHKEFCKKHQNKYPVINISLKDIKATNWEACYDIALIPYKKNDNGVVIEIKSIEKQKENEKENDFKNRINQAIHGALEQIERKKYYKELIDNRINIDKIIRIPIVFVGKERYINELTGEQS